ncbi:MAG TPA: ATP-binding protein [Acidobacteriaceae bacterium]|jgi:nitrogen fixation/metabolism regulation signal transduction histidine kinase|nr:ATP-binding protein [Acidobacteriaceae bacterium]
MATHPRHHRKPKRQSMSFEARLRVFCTVAALCLLSLAAALLALLHVSVGPLVATLGILLLVLLLVFAAFIEEAVRPVQTLANVVAALREEDYSFRARGASRDDAVGQLALEINALADTLQTQRVASLEAVALLRRVIAEMDAPVLAFDQDARLRLLNPAAERVFALEPAKHLSQSAAELNLANLLDEPTETILELPRAQGASRRGEPAQATRWMIRRSEFRQRGVPHTLVVLSDVSAALREEERLAWRRLIRVIGHEISNSLTPIKSIAGSLRSRILPNGSRPDAPSRSLANVQRDLQRGLGVIENRAESLNRFVQAYRQLAQLPAPVLKRVPLVPLLERVVSLEIRLDVRLIAAPDLDLLADPDQIEQLLINLVRNAVEAATHCVDEIADTSESTTAHPQVVIPSEAEGPDFSPPTAPCTPQVTLRATDEGDLACIAIEDNGPGLANPENVFVPLYTTKKSGSGVGLALARQIVEAHGGDLSLHNKPNGSGCLAEVRIPVADRSRT